MKRYCEEEGKSQKKKSGIHRSLLSVNRLARENLGFRKTRIIADSGSRFALDMA